MSARFMHKYFYYATLIFVALGATSYALEFAKEENKTLNRVIDKLSEEEMEPEAPVLKISKVKSSNEKKIINKDDNDKTSEDKIKSDYKNLDLMIEKNAHHQDIMEYIADAYEAFDAGHYEVALMFYEKALKINAKNEEALFGSAVVHQKLGSYEEAKKVYIQILEKNPKNKFALNNFLLILSYEKPESALDALRRLEAAEPELSIIPAQMATIYYRTNNFEQALKHFRKANRLEPSNLDYLYNIGLTFEKLNNKDYAQIIYNKIIQAMNAGHKSNISYHEVSVRLNKLENKTIR